MKKFFIGSIAALSLFVITACSGAQAIDYNDKIVGLHDNMTVAISDFNETLENEDAKADELATAHTKLKTEVSTNLKSLEEIEPFADDQGFKSAVTELFKFYQSITEKEYKEVVDIRSKEEMSEEDAQRLDTIINDLIDREETLYIKAQEAQEAFAKHYNFEIQ